VPADGKITWNETEPGEHTRILAVRAMDSFGILGPPVTKEIRFNVFLPDTLWTFTAAPQIVTDRAWKVPVIAAWTAYDTERRIEYRVDGGPWQTLPETGRVDVHPYNHRQVQFEFRAVEDDVFADPEPLSASIRILCPTNKGGVEPSGR